MGRKSKPGINRGTSGTVTCGCGKVLEVMAGVERRCQCSEQMYFIRMPARWICGQCSGGNHVKSI